MQISSLGYLENKIVPSGKLYTLKSVNINKWLYSIILKICGLYFSHSSHPIHTHTCSQIPFLSYPLNFISQTTLLSWSVRVKKIKNRNKHNANRIVAMWFFLFFRSFLPTYKCQWATFHSNHCRT